MGGIHHLGNPEACSYFGLQGEAYAEHFPE